MKFEDIIEAVRIELKRQDDKWGSQRNLEDRTWIAILVEEVGEIAKASLDHDRINLHTEVIQVIAVCVCWLENWK